MRMYLIRHGATQGNLEHRYVGRTDEGILESEKQGMNVIYQIRDQRVTALLGAIKEHYCAS